MPRDWPGCVVGCVKMNCPATSHCTDAACRVIGQAMNRSDLQGNPLQSGSNGQISCKRVQSRASSIYAQCSRNYPITRHAASLPEMTHFVIFDTPTPPVSIQHYLLSRRTAREHRPYNRHPQLLVHSALLSSNSHYLSRIKEFKD